MAAPASCSDGDIKRVSYQVVYNCAVRELPEVEADNITSYKPSNETNKKAYTIVHSRDAEVDGQTLVDVDRVSGVASRTFKMLPLEVESFFVDLDLKYRLTKRRYEELKEQEERDTERRVCTPGISGVTPPAYYTVHSERRRELQKETNNLYARVGRQFLIYQERYPDSQNRLKELRERNKGFCDRPNCIDEVSGVASRTFEALPVHFESFFVDLDLKYRLTKRRYKQLKEQEERDAERRVCTPGISGVAPPTYYTLHSKKCKALRKKSNDLFARVCMQFVICQEHYPGSQNRLEELQKRNKNSCNGAD